MQEENLTLIDNTSAMINAEDNASENSPIKSEVSEDIDNDIEVEDDDGYEEGTKREGWLHVRKGKQLLFVPKRTRAGGNGMETTFTNEDFTIQEGPNTIRLTVTFQKKTLDFKKLVNRMNKLVKQFQDMQLV